MLLIAGLLLWSCVHLSTAAKPNLRANIIGKIGEGPYKGLYSLLVLLSVVLIVMGFRAMPGGVLYVPPAGLRHATMLLMPIALILLIASTIPSDIKRAIGHPQMIAVKVWALAHLLSNGETRSVILFGGLMAWAVLEVIFINKRDGKPAKPAATGIGRVLLVVIIGLASTVGILFAHPWIAGVRLLPAG
ncbi:MAG: NnrU family protein [Oceanococcus sp.]